MVVKKIITKQNSTMLYKILFDLILNNVKILVEKKNSKAQVTLRINYTEKNITSDLPDEIDKVLYSVRRKSGYYVSDRFGK